MATETESQPPKRSSGHVEQTIERGLSLGAALALTMSWSLHHSIFLALVHAVMGWLYVFVWIVT